MDQTVKERLVGMGVLLVIGVLFIPLILDGNTAELEANQTQDLNLPIPSGKITHEMSFSNGKVTQLTLPVPDNTVKPDKNSENSNNQTSETQLKTIPSSGFVNELPKENKPTSDSKNSSGSNQDAVQNSTLPKGAIDRSATTASSTPKQDGTLKTSTALQSGPAVSPDSAWVVQVGSFSVKSSAEKQVNELKARGFPAFLRRYVTAENKVLFRVRVGPEKERARAEKLAERLLKAKIKGQIVSDP